MHTHTRNTCPHCPSNKRPTARAADLILIVVFPPMSDCPFPGQQRRCLPVAALGGGRSAKLLFAPAAWLRLLRILRQCYLLVVVQLW